MKTEQRLVAVSRTTAMTKPGKIFRGYMVCDPPAYQITVKYDEVTSYDMLTSDDAPRHFAATGDTLVRLADVNCQPTPVKRAIYRRMYEIGLKPEGATQFINRIKSKLGAVNHENHY